MLPPIYRILHDASPVANLVGTRIYRHGYAVQDTARPYITWQIITDDPENTLSETPQIDRFIVQVDCWSATDAGVEALAEAARNAMEARCHMTGMPVDEREPDTKLYRISLQFDYFEQR